MDLQDELFRIVDAMRADRIEYALCGGIAVIVHGYPRATRDIDILVQETDLDAVLAAVKPLGFDLESGWIPFDTGKPTERKVFRISRASGEDLLTLDLIVVGPFLADVWDQRQEFEVGDRRLTVISRDGLAKMKRAAGRPQDLADLSQLGIPEKP